MEMGLVVLQNPYTAEEKNTLVINSSKLIHIDDKYVSQLGIG